MKGTDHMSTNQLPPDLPGWSIVTRRGQIHLSLRIDGETINTRNRSTIDEAIADARFLCRELQLPSTVEQLELLAI